MLNLNSTTFDTGSKTTPENKYYYDASGEVVMSTKNNSRRVIRHLDGESNPVRTSEYSYYSNQYNLFKTKYSIYSTVLGKLLTEVDQNGVKTKTNVYGIGGIVATQNKEAGGEVVRFEHDDPGRQSHVETAPSGQAWYPTPQSAELDPLGSNVGFAAPVDPLNQTGGGQWGDPYGGYSCRLDGYEAPCSLVMYILSIGAGTPVINHHQPMFLGHWAPDRTTEPWSEYFVPALNLFNGLQSELDDYAPWYIALLSKKDAYRVLKNDLNCAKFFGLLDKRGKFSESKLDKLKEKVEYVIDVHTYANIANTVGNTITLEAKFFSDGIFKVSPAPYSLLNPRQGRAQTILHEIGHVLGIMISPDNYGFPNDPKSPANQNEKRILDNCTQGLTGLPDTYD